MRPFEYASPTRLRQAVALLAEEPERTALLAGGTDLLALMKDDVVPAERVVSVKGVAELHGVERQAGAGGDDLRIGAAVTLAELAAHPEVVRRHPSFALAAGHAAGPQIRNLGTIGGNLCQRPRCWYFRLGYGLAPRIDRGSGGESMVRAGDNRYHAVLGNDGDALFVSPSTVAPILVALGARVTIAGPEGEREVPVGDLYRLPGDGAGGGGAREHDLGVGEIVSALTVPAAAEGLRTASYEVRPGKSLDWSLATAAVALRMDGDRVGEVRIVLGQVAPTPWRAARAEEVLAGERLTEAVIARAAEAAVEGARPLSRNRYKIQLARVATRRALERAAGLSAGGRGS